MSMEDGIEANTHIGGDGSRSRQQQLVPCCLLLPSLVCIDRVCLSSGSVHGSHMHFNYNQNNNREKERMHSFTYQLINHHQEGFKFKN